MRNINIPSLQEAEKILKEAEELNPGPWGNHCRFAAECAGRIAKHCEGLDYETAYILGLLHDIGRRFGVSHFGHVVDGYRYMLQLGFYDAARICLTHSFQYQNIKDYFERKTGKNIYEIVSDDRTLWEK
jgi:HD superfamily phosphodiesterase